MPNDAGPPEDLHASLLKIEADCRAMRALLVLKGVVPRADLPDPMSKVEARIEKLEVSMENVRQCADYVRLRLQEWKNNSWKMDNLISCIPWISPK